MQIVIQRKGAKFDKKKELYKEGDTAIGFGLAAALMRCTVHNFSLAEFLCVLAYNSPPSPLGILNMNVIVKILIFLIFKHKAFRTQKRQMFRDKSVNINSLYTTIFILNLILTLICWA